MPPQFDHEKLKVYQQALRFVSWSDTVLADLDRRGPVGDQLERSAVSIALNIAEGNGKPPGRERCRFLDIARGSALECASCLDLLVAKRKIDAAKAESGKAILVEVVAMLLGMIRSNSDRVADREDVEYSSDFQNDAR